MNKSIVTFIDGGLEITRIYDAPIVKVWEACSQEEKFSKWWGLPDGGTMPYHTMDFREGGFMHFKVVFFDTVVWGKSIFVEIRKPDRIVIDDYFSDENGTLIDTVQWPKSRITLTLEAMGPQTKLTARHEGIGTGIPKIEEYSDGWMGTFENLARELKN
jgi:uncharacterized protein YndB with AHSA1/START domain